MSYLRRAVNRLVGQAIHRYGLLAHGDRIAVAVSGGADSILTLWFLREWQRKAPISLELLPIHLDMGFGADYQRLLRFLQGFGLGYHFEETGYGPYAHSPANRKNSPCFLCSMLRRKRLFQLAHRLGCNKIALGHNQDDIIETFFMNVIYSGEVSTMLPRQEMFKGLITIIRPLALVESAQVRRLVAELGLPVVENPCPSGSATRRSEVRRLLQEIYRSNRKARGNIMHALSNVRTEYLFPPGG